MPTSNSNRLAALPLAATPPIGRPPTRSATSVQKALRVEFHDQAELDRVGEILDTPAKRGAALLMYATWVEVGAGAMATPVAPAAPDPLEGRGLHAVAQADDIQPGEIIPFE